MQISAILGGKTVFDANGIPSVIGGEPGMIKSDDCECKKSTVDNETECTEVTEYWFKGELVHRSVNMTLKQGVLADALLGAF